MRKNTQNRLFRRVVALAGLALSLWVSAPAAAQVYSTTGTAYGGTYYYPGTVVVEPLLLPRTGSNDYLYTYDNVYGAGASAAGRMDRVVHNPPPQLYIPRQQPRVYLGY